MLSKINIKWQIIAGFLAIAFMTILAGGGGIIAIQLIRNNMSETAIEVNNSIQQETKRIENLSKLSGLITTVGNAKVKDDISNAGKILMAFQKGDDILSVMDSDLDIEISELITLKGTEISEIEKLNELNKRIIEKFEQSHKTIAKIVDDIVFSSIIAIEEIKHEDGLSLDSIDHAMIDEEINEVSTRTTQAISEITAGLAIRAYAYQIQANLEKILLSDDAAYVNYALSTLNEIYDNISSEIKQLNKIDAIGNIERLITEIKEMSPELLKTKQNVLIAQSKLSEASIKISEHMENSNLEMLANSNRLKKNVNYKLADSSVHVKKWRAVLIAICLISFLISIVISIAIPRSLVKSINVIVSKVRDIANGDLSQDITVERNDEIGLLAKHFSTMMKSLTGILNKLKNASLQITSSSTEILASSQQQVANARDQASAISQTTSAAVELSKTSEQIGENIKIVSQMTSHVLAGMDKIKNATDQTGKILESLNEKSKQIGKITELIDDVADQTNLLAVNASIEAARAGDQGRGFTVVADQISKLADSTAQSTKDINSLIELIQHEMTNAIVSMEQSNTSVDEEIKLAKDSAEKSKEIAMTANQQMSGSKQIAEAMSSIDESMKQIAAGSSQSASVVKQLISLADELKETMEEFKVKENINV